MTIIGITGHRPPGLGCSYDIPNPTYEKVYAALQAKFHELAPEKIISGMALGTDSWAAWAAMELGIPFIAAILFEGQDPNGQKIHSASSKFYLTPQSKSW